MEAEGPVRVYRPLLPSVDLVISTDPVSLVPKPAPPAAEGSRPTSSLLPPRQAAEQAVTEAQRQAREARRRELAKTRLYCRVFVGDAPVGTSEERSLGEDFTADFQELLSLRLVRWPERCRVRVYQKAFPMDLLVSEFYLAVPGANGTEPADAK